MIILKVAKKAGFHPLSRKHIFGKTTTIGGKGGSNYPSVFLGLKISQNLQENSCARVFF